MDLGDCGTPCASGCATGLLGNGSCESDCYNLDCNIDSLEGFGESDCKNEKLVGYCILDVLSNGICDLSCFNDQ